MTTAVPKPKSDHREWSIFGICLSFGVLAGLLERLAYSRSFLPQDDLWYAALVDLLMFIAIGIMLGLFNALFRRRSLVLVAVFLCCWLAAFDYITILHPSHPTPLWIPGTATAIAAVGAVVFALLRDRLVRFHRSASAMLLCYVVIYLVAVPLKSNWSERQALAAANAPTNAPNVVVIIVDALRADHLSAYGYDRITSPHLTRLAATGTLFENAIASSSWTLPSHASLLTGRLPSEHKAGDPNMRLDGTYPTLGTAFTSSGYRTAGFSANCFLFSRRVGLDRGFMHFEDGSVLEKLMLTNLGMRVHNLFAHLHLLKDVAGRQDAAEINQAALRWIDHNQGRPFFVTMTYFDVHEPFMPSPEYLRKFSGLRQPLNQFYWPEDVTLDSAEIKDEIDAYDASIAYVDDQISNFVGALAHRGLLQNTVIVVTSDHGESFNEHGFMFHGKGLYWELIHAPLIVLAPGRVPAGLTVATPVALQSLPATLMQMSAPHSSVQFPGPSLVPLLEALPRKQWTPVISELAGMGSSPKFPNYYGPVDSVVDWQWHYIVGARSSQLYPCCQEKTETEDHSGEPQGKAAVLAMRATLESEAGVGAFSHSQPNPAAPGAPSNKKMNETLHALGYVN